MVVLKGLFSGAIMKRRPRNTAVVESFTIGVTIKRCYMRKAANNAAMLLC